MTFVEATRLRVGQAVYWRDSDADKLRILTIRGIRFDHGSPENNGHYTVYIEAFEDPIEDGEISCLAGQLSLMKRHTLQQYLGTQHFFGADDGKGREVDYAQREKIVTRKLLQYGYTEIHWFNDDADSFGPLSRVVYAVNPDGVEEHAWYG